MLSLQTVRRLIIALSGATAGNAVATAINSASALAAASAASTAGAIVATSVSPTTNFASLAVGDHVLHIPATAGSSSFLTVVTAGTLPAAAVVGDLYIVVRAFAAPAASAVVL